MAATQCGSCEKAVYASEKIDAGPVELSGKDIPDNMKIERKEQKNKKKEKNKNKKSINNEEAIKRDDLYVCLFICVLSVSVSVLVFCIVHDCVSVCRLCNACVYLEVPALFSFSFLSLFLCIPFILLVSCSSPSFFLT